MPKEPIKSVILFALVVSSAILTYMVWSYQPEFSEIETNIDPVSNIGASEPISFNQVMRAYQLVRVEGNDIQGTIQEEAVVGIREYISETEIEDINVYNSLDSLETETNEDEEEEFLIVDYPSDMPAKSLFQVLEFTYEGELPDYNFSRIIVDLAGENVRFSLINEDLDRVAVAPTNLDSEYLKSLLEDHEEHFEQYSGVITNQQTSNNKTAIYGPSEPGDRPVEHFLSSTISANLVNDILFMEDGYTTEQNEQVYVYEGMSNIAQYNSEAYDYTYTDLDESLTGEGNPHQVINRSFSFLNSHSGLNNRHMLFNYNEEENESVYRSTMNGYLVFSEGVSDDISVKYGQNSVYEYNRPLLRVNAEVPEEGEQELVPLENVRYQIALNEELDLQNVSNITIGYNMSFSEDQTELNVIRYTPEWYVKYDGDWFRFDEGGLEE